MKNRFFNFIILLLICSISLVPTGCSSAKQSQNVFADKTASAEGSTEDAGTDKTTMETTEPTTEETTETTTQAVTIDIVMIGDMLIHDGVYNSGRNPDGTYNFDHLFTHTTADFRAADIAIANQETILGGTQMGLSNYPLFNSPQEIGDALSGAGISVVLHATNHTLDKGVKGIENTLDFWQQKHPEMVVLGIHGSQEHYDNNSVYIFEKDGVKIALANYTYGTNGIPVPAGKEYMINLMNEEKVKKDIEYARANADFVIVCPHWGTEYTCQPDAYQKKWAQFFADNKVDLVIGTHPHVVQPVEYVTGQDGHSTLVYYSLGNFVSNQDKISTMLGGMAKIRLSNEGGVHIESYSIEPVVTHMLFGYRQITTYKLSEYTEELAAQNRVSMYGRRLTMAELNSICREVLKLER